MNCDFALKCTLNAQQVYNIKIHKPLDFLVKLIIYKLKTFNIPLKNLSQKITTFER